MQKEAFAVIEEGTNRLAARRVAALAMAVLLGMSVAACAREGSSTQVPNALGAEGNVPEVLAVVGDDSITLTELRDRPGSVIDQIDEQYRSQLATLEAQYRRARSSQIEMALDTLVLERMFEAEARKQNKTVNQLLSEEAGPGGLEPNEVEIAAWYENNKSRLSGSTLDQSRASIADHLRNERKREAVQKLEQRLRAAIDVQLFFEPYRVVFNNANAPSLGNEHAPVTVVEFSDFQCPYCRSFAPTLKQLEQQFGDQVYVVYRQFPIPSIHKDAIKAAEASLCAHDQGKFWALHDMMFAEQNRLSVPELKDKARRVGLDQKKFDSCLDSGRHSANVQTDMQEGGRIGVNGTPAVFVNGVYLGGAVPYETVVSAVQRELSRTAKR